MSPSHPSTLVKLALDWAAVWHRTQLRKYPDVEVPYMSHVAGVASILSRHGFPDNVVAAGALHDVIEDCNVTHAMLTARFGIMVADLVRHVSEADKTVSWEERKRRYLEHFSQKPWDAQAITLADKIDNLQSISVCTEHYGDPWRMFKRDRDTQVDRFRQLFDRTKPLPPHPLIDEFAANLARVESLPHQVMTTEREGAGS